MTKSWNVSTNGWKQTVNGIGSYWSLKFSGGKFSVTSLYKNAQFGAQWKTGESGGWVGEKKEK